MLDQEQVAIIKGMLGRGDAQHEIAAHFHINAGRIAEINTGQKFSEIKPAPLGSLPTKRQPRFIDPNANAEKQYEQLLELIKSPPENSRIVIFTPELAAHILDRLNSNNRRKRVANIKRFSESMTADNWILTGDTIKFSRSGFLLDGQNRLAACVRSGARFRTHAVFGIADDAFSRIDANAVRTNPDTFQIAGVPYASITAPAVRWLMIGTDRGRKIENEELLAFYRTRVECDRLQEAARNALAIGKALPTGALAAHLYLFEQKDQRTAARFLADLTKCRAGGRKLLEKIRRLRTQQMGRLNELQTNALLIQAWNSYRAGKTLTAAMLNWDENKEYPTIA